MSEYASTPTAVVVEERSFIQRVFAWMAAGLGLTGVIAYALGTNDRFVAWFTEHDWFLLGLIGAELLCVFSLAALLQRMTSATATAIFLGYAALNGVTFSLIFAVYTSASIFAAFLVTGGMFAAMAVWGWTTKRDLSGLGSILFMGLFGLILASVVNIFWASNGLYFFWASNGLYWITTYAGIVIFCGLTAYDMQKLKALNVPGDVGSDEDRKEAIAGALALYLDFINLFLFILRIFGDRK